MILVFGHVLSVGKLGRMAGLYHSWERSPNPLAAGLVKAGREQRACFRPGSLLPRDTL